MVSSIVDKLKCFNDQNFKFDPKYHKYTYGGKNILQYPIQMRVDFIPMHKD